MIAYLIRRFWQTFITLLIMSLLVFVGVYHIGNPADILVSAQATPEEYEMFIRNMGLDKPMWEQYVTFLGNLFQGDLGNSFVYNEPAVDLIFRRLPATLELTFAAMGIALVFGLPLGIYAGLKPKSGLTRCIMTGSILGFSLPTFWIGLMMVMVFAVWLGWFPASGRGGLSHLVLPAINLALFKVSLVIRLTRAGVLENMLMDYVRFARAKGLSETRVVVVHVLKNTLIPLVTVLGLELGNLIAFAVVTETIFAWPGMGKLIIDSITVLDRPVILAYLLIVVVMFSLINLVVDILYSVIDPRVRYE
ncbi:ABC transporter permease [Desulfovibrio sp. OttesenSCG-928-I05]|nr:ABC transporter permease [Desulfovibrio sp. OttesenSCG-928-I05]